MLQALLSVDKLRAKEVLRAAREQYQPIEVVEGVIVPSLERIGNDWVTGEVSLSQVYMSGKICNEILGDIIPDNCRVRERQLNIAIAVLEDFHTLGKQIVKGFLQASGFEVVDYGMGVSVDDLVGRTVRDKVDVLLISVLMLPSALRVREVRRGLRQRQSGAIIVVGGAPFNFDEELYKEVEADYMGRTVSDAISIIHTIEKLRG
ncbi:cobalamin B12-binding domain-containing protein [Candidatus Magnetobacterium casense]|uniref:Cobalamin B12-binding domain-containing protein n=1 Tax=Candidatus Magnetobacterium casense TaxID=1455061 RepID=A0ABS6RXN4_9BACT|nr:cobalamin-dependent protein [Candidatus Magnetobacterium casensis]MBV6341376.1 cobalamin B12-binding domain-containing protein [Candidatus Magnetobacterium casensis]